MSHAWSAELVVSSALAQSLIETQFPQLVPVKAESIGAGFDNTAFCVNSAHIFRFPRRHFAVQFLGAETRLMPVLSPRLPLPVPRPMFVGHLTDAYPWPFAGYQMLPGRTACSATLDDDQRAAMARPLARFFAALHAIPVADVTRYGAGPDTIARLDLVRRVPRARENLAQLAERRLVEDVDPFMTILDSAPANYAPATDTLVHGDLYARHLLIDVDGRLAGVIDWGDVHLGDRAVDLAIAHTFLPPMAREAFRNAYGPVDDLTWSIARLRALWHTLTVLAYASDVGDADLMREGQVALRHLAGVSSAARRSMI
jgi:aminoglycoside phosphotransferase (APT) family kinase protein